MIESVFLLGFIIILGFIAMAIFEKTGISQVIILILLGFLIGPELGIIKTETSAISDVAPFMSAVALILLLFDGGLNLNIKRVFQAFPKASAFTVVTFVITMILTAILFHFLGIGGMKGLLVGAILGGTSSAIVIAMVEKAKVRDEIKTILTLESTITDVLVIITGYVLIELIAKGGNIINRAINLIASSFSIATVVGAIAAFAWLFVLSKMKRRSFSYMLTIATAFLLYSVVEIMGGSGSFSVFVFAIVLGNIRSIMKAFDMEDKFFLEADIKHFQEEVTFFVRTFFFVYLGLLFIPSRFTIESLLLAIAITIFGYLGRAAAQKIILNRYEKKEEIFIVNMMPRGLAAAVMASIPLTRGIEIPGLVEIVLGGIILSNLIATIGLFNNRRGAKEKIMEAEKAISQRAEEIEKELEERADKTKRKEKETEKAKEEKKKIVKKKKGKRVEYISI